MDLDARPYRAFIAIAECGSFGRAAKALNISQPALSAQLKEFERRLGFALFARSNRQVALTTEGSLFLDRARRLVTETEWARSAAREISTNQLRIGAAHHTANIAERNALIDDFMIQAPDVPLRVMRRTPAQLRDDLQAADIDVAITLEFVRDHEPDTGVPLAFKRYEIASRAVRLWVPREHTLAGAATLGVDDLADVAIGMIDRSHGLDVAEGVAGLLRAGSLHVRSMPEGDAQAVARQAARLRAFAVDLGWHPGDASMVSLPVREWTERTRLVVLSRPGALREGARRFLSQFGNDD
jgi:DNA-binding transcriptional LysR family regulator